MKPATRRPARDYLFDIQTNWLKALEQTAHRAASEGDPLPGVDGDRMARDIFGIYLAYHQAKRLLRDSQAESRALAAFATLTATNRYGLAEAPRHASLAGYSDDRSISSRPTSFAQAGSGA